MPTGTDIDRQHHSERAGAALGPRVLFAAGGTGGHIYPAIAIADAVRRLAPRSSVAFAGTQNRMEWRVVPEAGYEIHPIRAAGVDRRRPARNLRLPLTLAGGVLDSWRLISGFDPDVVVGTGGFVTGPVLLVAALRGKPVVLQEQNAYAGVTNKLLARRAASIHVAFDEARAYFPADRTVKSGNPTRAQLLDAERDAARRELDVPQDADVLFIFGGSLGGAAINRTVADKLEALLADAKRFVLWQTGRLYYEEMVARVPEHPRLRMMQYVDRMDLAYAACDLVLSRSGATTCSELLVTGTPAILVPSPNVAEDHQTKNARALAEAGAAVLLPESRLAEELASTVDTLFRDDAGRLSMSRRAKDMAKPNAAVDIARDVLDKAGWKRLSPSA